jgi:hypothetical protein
MGFAISHRQNLAQARKAFALLLLLAAYISINKFKNHNSPESKMGSVFVLRREGYDAKTGKWVNKKPGPAAFSISPDDYQRVKNWYSTDSGTNNPNFLPVMAPKEGYSYIYTPYKDAAHPNVHGMSIQGQNGYKGYWYADDLSKATDSSDDNGQAVPIPVVKDKSPVMLEYGGYDARSGNWVHTVPSGDDFPISQGTYLRVKNWYATAFGTNNPLQLPLEIPKEDFTYLFVPFKDGKHPGIIGMSFQGDGACKGYWYADKIGATQDTVMTGSPNPTNNVTPTQTAPPPSSNEQNQPVQLQQQSVPTQNQQAPPPPSNSNTENGRQPK